jgi:hypothetical protein
MTCCLSAGSKKPAQANWPCGRNITLLMGDPYIAWVELRVCTCFFKLLSPVLPPTGFIDNPLKMEQ